MLKNEEKQMYEQQEREQYSAKRAGAIGGGNVMGPTTDRAYDPQQGGAPRRAGLRQRIEEAILSAERNIRRAQAANRAKQIIDAHPEFAELLDLLNEF